VFRAVVWAWVVLEVDREVVRRSFFDCWGTGGV
jgi:hypothetical protein